MCHCVCVNTFFPHIHAHIFKYIWPLSSPHTYTHTGVNSLSSFYAKETLVKDPRKVTFYPEMLEVRPILFTLIKYHNIGPATD